MSKIMFLDIEVSPDLVYTWGVGPKVPLSYENIVKERQVICICWKWEGKKKVHYLHWDKKQNDKTMLKKFVKELHKADLAVGHNGDRFDIKWLKTRLLFHRLPPATNLQSIDTLKLVRNNFYLNSNRLDYIGEYLGVGKKLDHSGFSLWKNVCAGDEKALNQMIKYCQQDVKLLEKVYHQIKPYVNTLPVHMGILEGESRLNCPACGNAAKFAGLIATKAGTYRRRICKTCGHQFKHWKKEKVE